MTTPFAAFLSALACLAAMTIAQPAAPAPLPEEGLAIELNEGTLIRLDRPANSVFIANPEIADVNVKSSRLVYVFGRKPGETTLYAVDSNDQIVTERRIRVAHNMSGLEGALARLLPEGGLEAVSIDGAIVLSGLVATAAEAENARRLAARFIAEGEEIISRLDVTAPNQVNLRVRVAEVSRQVVNQLGINWDAAIMSSFTLGIATGVPVIAQSVVAGGTLSPPGTGEFLTRQTDPAGNIFGQLNTESFDLNVLLDALAENGLITVLAEPNLTAITGETASFLAGGEFPIPVPQSEGRITVEFKKFGVSLAFTPTVLSENRISMRVRPEVSQLSNNGAIQLQDFVIPALTTRRAETTVELGSGQSFAIAGLLLDNSLHDSDKVPGLGDIPVLGQLFQSDRFERNESELVIIVTPYIVRPVSSDLVASTDPLVGPPPGRAEPATVPIAAGPRRLLPFSLAEAGGRDLRGPVGFIID